MTYVHCIFLKWLCINEPETSVPASFKVNGSQLASSKIYIPSIETILIYNINQKKLIVLLFICIL